MLIRNKIRGKKGKLVTFFFVIIRYENNSILNPTILFLPRKEENPEVKKRDKFNER